VFREFSRNFGKIISRIKYLTKCRKISFAKLITRQNLAKYKKCLAELAVGSGVELILKTAKKAWSPFLSVFYAVESPEPVCFMIFKKVYIEFITQNCRIPGSDKHHPNRTTQGEPMVIFHCFVSREL